MNTARNASARITALVTLAALFGAAAAQASSVTLDPTSATVNANGTVTVNLKLNATDVPGSHPGKYLGNIIIDYDPSQLTYGLFNFAGGIVQTAAPAQGTQGARKTVSLGFDQAPDNGIVGTFTFTAKNAPGAIAHIGITDQDSFFGTFISHLPTNQPFAPAFTGASVTINAVPVPGAAGLLLTGLGLLGSRLRRRALTA